MTRTGRPRSKAGERRRSLGISLGDAEIRALQELAALLGESQGAIVGRLIVQEHKRAPVPAVHVRRVDTFTAEVQYRDWSGEAKADHQMDFIEDELVKRGLKSDDEFVIGFRSSMYDSLGTDIPQRVSVTAWVVPGTEYASARDYLERSDPPIVREKRFDMALNDWASLFKQLSIALALRGFEDIIGREYLLSQE